MHFFTSLLLITATATTALAHRPHSFARDGHQHLHQHQKRLGEVFVTGANGIGDGQVHARLEINDLAMNRPDQFALFILAMKQWQAQSNSSETSYYQISGIHGVPRVPWNGVQACDTCGDADGYCTHASVLFPAWHRTYLALYEQEFLNVVQQVALAWTGTNKVDILAAAQTMRIPYWDWAAKPDANNNVLAAMIAAPQIIIQGPSGPETVDNPLYTYAIPDESAMYYQPFTSWPDTFRYPNANTAAAQSDEQSAINAFNNIQGQMQESIYQLLSGCDNYLSFSNDGSATANCPNSLEGIHNTIHTTAGGPGSGAISGGHMTYLPLAAFDPIFWLHHANVDRLFALWQTIHPDSYGASQVAPHNTWTIKQGSTQNADSPLTPFRRDLTNFWTTNLVENWADTFKYTYPEFLASDGSATSIAKYVNQLYGSSPSLTASSISKLVEKSSVNPLANASATAKRALQPTKSVQYAPSGIWGSNGTATGIYPTGTGSVTPKYSNGNGSQYEYSCNVNTPRFAFNTSYSVYVFDGQPSDDDSSNWLGQDNCVGSLGIFAGGEMTGDSIVSGGVPMTKYLQKKVQQGSLGSMSQKDVNAYMKKNLNWRIVKQGEEVHPSQLSGFQAALYGGSSSPASGGSLPQWSAMTPQVEATEGKAGGVNSVEEAHNAWPQYAPAGYSPSSGSGEATTVVVTKTSTAECSESTTASVPYSAPSGPASAPTYASTPAPYPSSSGSTPYSPIGGTAAPSGYASPSGYSPSSPSSSPITPYTGAGAKISGNSVLGIAICALAGMLLF